MAKHAGMYNASNGALWNCHIILFCLSSIPSLSGSLTGSVSTDGGNTTTTTDSVDQVSPTMPRSTKQRVSGKLRRSASAISKSSNWALQPVPLLLFFFLHASEAFNLFLKNLHTPSCDCKALFCVVSFPCFLSNLTVACCNFSFQFAICDFATFQFVLLRYLRQARAWTMWVQQHRMILFT